jgi:preprotein translocase subunit SecB
MADATPTAAEQEAPVFSIEKLYVKDVSLETPNAPQIFLEREAPQIDVQMHTESQQLEPSIYQTLLSVTVTAKIGDKTMFLVEVAQAGIFVIRNLPQADIEQILGISCPNILYPYAREVVSDLVNRGTFPPLVLNPVNFDALYQAQKQAELQQGQAAQMTAPATVQ